VGRFGRASLALGLTLAGSLTACGGEAVQAPAKHPETVVTAGGITDAQFAEAVHDLLLAAPGSPERARLLSAVLGKQMERAVARYRSHHAGRGLAAVVGGLYLVHAGELTTGALGPTGKEALREATRELAVHGDEGRARALYDVSLHLANDESKSEIQQHLDALAAWTRDELKAGPGTIATGAIESASVARSLLEPSQAAKDDALKATLDWIATALELQTRFREKKVRPSREEVGEAVRALHSGNDILAQIFLRDADGAGAMRALSRSPLREAIRPELKKALEALGGKATATEWLDVLHAITPDAHEREQDEDEVMEDRELARAATFGVALEAYRLDPAQPESAAMVAAVLQDLGLAEASPAVIAEATRAHPDARTVSGALTITLRAMGLELEADDADAVRRTYAAAAPLLAIAEQRTLAPELQPNAARVRAMMGEVELQQGGLDAARALLSSSAAEEKSGAVLLALARLDRHDGDAKAALGDLRSAIDAPDTARDAALRGEVLLLTSDLSREAGDAGTGRQSLVDALMTLAKARTSGTPDDRARIEQILSRVLDRFGAKDKAQQALERAFEATPHDKREIASTLGQIIARAFVRKDLLAARDGLTRAMAAELTDDDLVYYALWVRLLEREQNQRTDGAAARVFSAIPDDGRWAGKLAAFGAGKITAAQLASFAATATQKTEAAFYAAMDARVAGQKDPGDAALRSVLRGGGIDLMEVVIARELIRGAAGGQTEGPLPSGVALP